MAHSHLFSSVLPRFNNGTSMTVPSLELHRESQTDRHPLLMERPVNQSNPEHIIDFRRDSIASSSGSHIEHPPCLDTLPPERTPSTSTRAPNLPSSSTTPSSRNSSFRRRGDRYGRRHRSPLNTGLWISIELTVTVSQIIASIIVLALSRDEKPHAPLFVWVVGYAAGCVATLPHLYWRYIHRNSYGPEQEPTRGQLGSTQSNPPSESTTYMGVSVPRILEEEQRSNIAAASWNELNTTAPSPRLNMLIDHFKMVLDCFFAVWFVVGNVWIFGGHSSSSSAPNLYRLCVVFLTFSCIGYAMPFILCATICCCLPCIISIMGFHEDHAQTRGATPESVSILPIYKFKLKGNVDREESEIHLESSGGGGVVGTGTDRERTISAEDAVCCICLAKYADEEDLRELPCSHFFHVECVDKWLKINALCPLCKHEVRDSAPSDLNPGGRRGERRVGTVTTREIYGGTVF